MGCICLFGLLINSIAIFETGVTHCIAILFLRQEYKLTYIVFCFTLMVAVVLSHAEASGNTLTSVTSIE